MSVGDEVHAPDALIQPIAAAEVARVAVAAPRNVVVDQHANYFGTPLQQNSLATADGAH